MEIKKCLGLTKEKTNNLLTESKKWDPVSAPAAEQSVSSTKKEKDFTNESIVENNSLTIEKKELCVQRIDNKTPSMTQTSVKSESIPTIRLEQPVETKKKEEELSSDQLLTIMSSFGF
jgi:hypothetical protein